MSGFEGRGASKRNKRIQLLFWILAFSFMGVAAHMAYIQLVFNSNLTKNAIAQQSQFVSLEIPSRGEILDAQLRPLSSYQEVKRLVVFPAAVKDKVYAANAIAQIMGREYSWAAGYIKGQPGIIPVDLNDDQAKKLTQAHLDGLIVAKVKLRSRKPLLASHLIGYLGKNDHNQWAGQTGIENLYDNELKESSPGLGARIFLDGRGNFISGLGYKIETVKNPDRKNVILSINKDIQNIVENVLDDFKSIEAAVVVMEAGTGDIVAMASRPDYSLDTASQTLADGQLSGTTSEKVYEQVYKDQELPVKNQDSFVNRCLAMYQPGSVFKVIVASAALEEKVVEPDSLFYCTGDKDPIVKCANKAGHGTLNFEEAIAQSCNPFFARVGIKLGGEKLIEYAKRFGMDKNTIIGYRDIDRSQELGKISQDYNLVNASIGQWPVESTVVQITGMMNTIANNGVYVTPRLVKEIRASNGKIVKSFPADPGKRAVSLNTAQFLQGALEKVNTEGTGKEAWLANWGSAGKTGSAQVGNDRINAWYSGYAPVGTPSYVATVMVNDGISGGKSAAPIFREIMKRVLEYRVSTKH